MSPSGIAGPPISTTVFVLGASGCRHRVASEGGGLHERVQGSVERGWRWEVGGDRFRCECGCVCKM